MANEATLIVETKLPYSFTVADGAGIEKGAVLKLADPMTASAANGLSDFCAGIAAAEKINGDGKTHLSVYDEGIFRVTLSGACTVGESLVCAGGASSATQNKVSRNISVLSGARILGYALETGADGETILMKLNIQNNVVP